MIKALRRKPQSVAYQIADEILEHQKFLARIGLDIEGCTLRAGKGALSEIKSFFKDNDAYPSRYDLSKFMGLEVSLHPDPQFPQYAIEIWRRETIEKIFWVERAA